MGNSRKFFRTLVSVEILSEEPLPEMELEELGYQMSLGSYYGDIEYGLSEEVDSSTMAKLLIDQGSDPEFFGLDEDGNDVDDDDEGEIEFWH